MALSKALLKAKKAVRNLTESSDVLILMKGKVLSFSSSAFWYLRCLSK